MRFVFFLEQKKEKNTWNLVMGNFWSALARTIYGPQNYVSLIGLHSTSYLRYEYLGSGSHPLNIGVLVV